ncbi:MAG: tRNA epoxyqueuosine(34) reductase QueG [Bacteroidota bacterium]
MKGLKPISEVSESIREEALQLGFAGCGFSRAGPLNEDAIRLKEWLDGGYHARMGYMAGHFEKRTDPVILVEGAKSVISLLYNYKTDRVQEDPRAPVLSKYAYGKDYHFVMKERMNRLFEYINSNFGPVEGRVFTDSAPVLERTWAQRAGLGWIGKNSSLISQTHGSFVFIGELIVDLELEYSQAEEKDRCGSCNRCVEACPTGAILSSRTIDAGLCISYQTIENREAIPPELQGNLENRVFGCDICQDVCPWNNKALNHQEPAFDPPAGLLEMTANDWANLDREQFNLLFKDSPVKRAGYRKIKETLRHLVPSP